MAIKRFANSHDYHKRVKLRKPFNSATSIGKRQESAEKTIEQDWNQVKLTDESAIEMGEAVRKECTIRRPGEEYNPQHIQPSFHSQRKSLRVYGATAKKERSFELREGPSRDGISADRNYGHVPGIHHVPRSHHSAFSRAYSTCRLLLLQDA